MFDNPIIIILVIAAALLRWLWEKSRESRAENQDPERPTVPGKPIPRSDETQSEEERIRRFLEALGQPTTSPPPPKVVRKREFQPSPLPPLTTVPPPLPPPIWAQPILIEEAAPRPVETPEEEPIFTPAAVQEIDFEVRDLDAQTSSDFGPAAIGQQSFLLKLRSAQGLRDAIVLREIFGPPRSLQALETAL